MDVDMPDAGPSGPAKSKTQSKTAKAGGTADEGKKRFEVKKLIFFPSTSIPAPAIPLFAGSHFSGFSL
ncbi:MAG: hypothetical protein LQ343_001658 [Gyalolechia ehrenbergii]|nr:MAG: hypothetical protein LQ343_001658 [Gyalolechia ehrenbergii]